MLETILSAAQGIVLESFSLFVEMSPYLLLGMFVAGLLHVFVSKDFVAKQVGGRDFLSVLKAAVFGVPLPLCSCGVIPTAVYLKESGASKPAVVSFLISTPQTGIDSIIATYGMLGPVMAVYRPISALAMGLFGGAASLFTTKKSSPSSQISTLNLSNGKAEQNGGSLTDKVRSMLSYSFVRFIDDISSQFVAGVFIAGLISFLIPDNFFADTILSQGILSMLLMALVAVPMYVCATGSIPIAVALIAKGFSPGAAFVFLAAGPASNAASMAVLMKSLGKRTTAVYTAAITALSIAFGFLLNYLIDRFDVDVQQMLHHSAHQEMLPPMLVNTAGAVFGVLIIASFYRKYVSKYFRKTKKEEGQLIVRVKGMDCRHCASSVESMVAREEGVDEAAVDLEKGLLSVKGNPDINKVKDAVERSGYEYAGLFEEGQSSEGVRIDIEGMSCNHCVSNVEKALSAIDGVDSVDVRLDEGCAYVSGSFNMQEAKAAIEKSGYSVK